MSSEGEFLEPSESGADKDGHRYELSPDGSVRATFHPHELRNNEWWETVRVTWEQSGKPLVFAPDDHEARIGWTGERDFALFSGKAFSAGEVRIDVDVDAGRGRVSDAGIEFPLNRAAKEIEKAYRAHLKTLPSTPEVPPVSNPSREPLDRKSLIAGTIIAAILIAAIALVSLAWETDNPPEPTYPEGPQSQPVEVD
jgi:hypothetical protein